MADDAPHLVRIKHFTDITGRPRYVPQVDAKTSPLKHVIGKYDLRPEVRCGLVGCNTPHNLGLLILTADGKETNIGHICGTNHFGTEVVRAARQDYEKRLALQIQSESLRELKASLPQLRARVQALNDGEKGDAWGQRCLASLRAELPPEVLAEVLRRQRYDNRVVVVSKRRTDSEIDEIKARTGSGTRASLRYETKSVGTIEGLDMFDWRNHSALARIADNIEKFDAVSIDDLTPEERKEWTDWAGSLPAEFDRAQLFTRQVELFATDATMVLLRQLTDKPAVRAKIERLRWAGNTGEFM